MTSLSGLRNDIIDHGRERSSNRASINQRQAQRKIQAVSKISTAIHNNTTITKIAATVALLHMLIKPLRLTHVKARAAWSSLYMAMSSSASSKFSSPPSIADVKRHAELIKQLKFSVRDFDILSSEDKRLPEPTTIPLDLQAWANKNSLKPSPEEVQLQDDLEKLPFSRMAGAPDEANLLCLLLEMMDAKVVVEVGVFRGTTTLTMAKCLKKMNDKGTSNHQTRKVIGLDVSSDYAEIGRKYWRVAGVDDLIDFRIGDAKDSLSKLLRDEMYGENSVDLCFIDADKTSYDDYYEKCLRLTKSGGLIVVDNTLWGGSVAVPDPILDALVERANQISEDDDSDQAKVARRARDTKAIKQLTKKIYNDERIERVSFLTIADGVTICRKK